MSVMFRYFFLLVRARRKKNISLFSNYAWEKPWQRLKLRLGNMKCDLYITPDCFHFLNAGIVWLNANDLTHAMPGYLEKQYPFVGVVQVFHIIPDHDLFSLLTGWEPEEVKYLII